MLWGKPKLPVEPKMREWVDSSMQRFTEMFGSEAITWATTVVPTEACFPDDWDGTAIAAELLFSRVCGYMGVDRGAVDLKICLDDDDQQLVCGKCTRKHDRDDERGIDKLPDDR